MDKNILLLRTIFEKSELGQHDSSQTNSSQTNSSQVNQSLCELSQRELSQLLNASLGSTNKLIKTAIENKLITQEKSAYRLTEAGRKMLEPYKVDGALILSAGFGSRFVPLTYETPKGLLEVFGEPMLERQIKQLHEVGVKDICIMVGYMKEKFEYLRDKYGVQLIYNPEYTEKNTLSTIYHAIEFLNNKNCYILSSDNWMRHNLYHSYEAAAWYAAAHSDGPTSEWVLISDKKGRITDTYPGGKNCDYMYGPAYFSREFSKDFLPVLKKYYEMPGTEQFYWEHVLMEMLNGQSKKKILAYFGHCNEAKTKAPEIYVNLQPENEIYEFENLEELRAFDEKYNNDSGSETMQLVSRVFEVPESSIRKIRCLKAGMTNNSWLFEIKGKSYICRIPGEGTGKLINRKEEKSVYDAIADLNITERLVYFDAETGYKISRFYENSRNADPKNKADLKCCMQLLRKLHSTDIKLNHSFDIAGKLEYYEDLCMEAKGITAEHEDSSQREKQLSKVIPFNDYISIRRKSFVLLDYLKKLNRKETISHIDSVVDNFIFLPGADVSESERDISRLRLIDWEYSAMCDPLIDVAMCIIYSYMNEAEAKELEELYFGRKPDEEEENVINAYIALGGLLWALWGVYKEFCGVQQYSDYTLRMYRYFKEYEKKVSARL
ncbi:MAG: sugar phosphate nucleotidyltransferase [Eubacteriales bacterium]|nr:sugar phosphate nucleotidyltransferase [Eubacteriales bacterium]